MSEAKIDFRSLSSDDDMEQCLELQRATWGYDFTELVPPTILRISQKVGGVAAGAFDESGSMLGFVFGISGVRYGRVSHWSHMLAVWDRAKGLGLGKRLKAFQRELLLEIGCEVVFWSYDPLVARNANLNIERLGARPVEYVRDMYGGNTGSELHSALGTDRLVVAWELSSPTVEAFFERPRGSTAGPDREALVFTLDSLGEQGQPSFTRSDLEVRDQFWVEVPADIEEVKTRSIEEGWRWRSVVRAALEEGLEAGFAIVGIAGLGNDEDRRFFYRLVKAED